MPTEAAQAANDVPPAPIPIKQKRKPLRSLPDGHPRLTRGPMGTSITDEELRGISWRVGMQKIREAAPEGTDAAFCRRIDFEPTTWNMWMNGAKRKGQRGSVPTRKVYGALLCRFPGMRGCVQPTFGAVTHMKNKRKDVAAPIVETPSAPVAPALPKVERTMQARAFQHWATMFAALPAPALSTFRHYVEAGRLVGATLEELVARVDESAARPVAT